MSQQRPPGAPQSFWHVGFSVADIEESIRFYCDGLGLEVRSRNQTSATAVEVWNSPPNAVGQVVFLGLPGGGDLVEIYQISGIPQQQSAAAPPWDFASAHLCLVSDDLDALFEHMKSLGYRARSERAVPMPAGVVAGGKVAYFIDPDGFHVEVVEWPRTH